MFSENDSIGNLIGNKRVSTLQYPSPYCVKLRWQFFNIEI